MLISTRMQGFITSSNSILQACKGLSVHQFASTAALQNRLKRRTRAVSGPVAVVHQKEGSKRGPEAGRDLRSRGASCHGRPQRAVRGHKGPWRAAKGREGPWCAQMTSRSAGGLLQPGHLVARPESGGADRAPRAQAAGRRPGVRLYAGEGPAAAVAEILRKNATS